MKLLLRGEAWISAGRAADPVTGIVPTFPRFHQSKQLRREGLCVIGGPFVCRRTGEGREGAFNDRLTIKYSAYYKLWRMKSQHLSSSISLGHM